MKLAQYEPLDFEDTDVLRHMAKLTFQCGDARSEVITTIIGPMSGCEVIQSVSDLETGCSVPFKNEVNKKHCQFYDDNEDVDPIYTHKEVEELHFFKADGEYSHTMAIEPAINYLVGAEIISIESIER